MEIGHSEPGSNSRRSLHQIAIFTFLQPLICYLKIIFLFEFTFSWHLKLRMVNLQKRSKRQISQYFQKHWKCNNMLNKFLWLDVTEYEMLINCFTVEKCLLSNFCVSIKIHSSFAISLQIWNSNINTLKYFSLNCNINSIPQVLNT